jgi:DNA-binding NtrC family response regulator
MFAKQLGAITIPTGTGKQAYVSGISRAMEPVQRLISEIASTDIPVLLVGESGTGKEIVALHIHELSPRRDLPFTKWRCGALATESQEENVGNLEKVNLAKDGQRDGTLFFDEISELDATWQRRLLHWIPDGNGVPANQTWGGRIISSTAREMESEVGEGSFRGELYYRLAGVCLQLPPLRHRREDIPLLVQHFLGKYAGVFQRAEMALSDQVMRLLLEHPWPGNIRQLENVIKRIVALENEELGIADLKLSPAVACSAHANLASPSLKVASRTASRQAERQLILQTLEKTHWNRKRAAEALQISYKSLLFKLKQIQVPESGGS